jgi:hypothetical protein
LSLPSARGRQLSFAALALLVILGLCIAAISSGVFDPQPLGTVVQRLSPVRLAVPAGARKVSWQEQLRLPQPPYSIKMQAALAQGDPDSGYGLLLASPAGNTAVMVSPTGYVSIFKEYSESSKGADAIQPWQPWPHVQRGSATNEIWLDVSEEQARVRINGELFWTGELAGSSTAVGLVAESFADSALIDFGSLELITPVQP